jgi:hypothetical protein
MKLRFSLSILYLTAAWLLAAAALVSFIYLLTYYSGSLADLVPDIEFKQGVMIQTIDGERFIRETRADGSTHFVPIK